jgi:hypothetical protein
MVLEFARSNRGKEFGKAIKGPTRKRRLSRRAHNALLKPYYTSGVTIGFPFDKPLPAGLVRKIIKWRLAENERREAAKAKGKSTGYTKPRATPKPKPKTGPRPPSGSTKRASKK